MDLDRGAQPLLMKRKEKRSEAAREVEIVKLEETKVRNTNNIIYLYTYYICKTLKQYQLLMYIHIVW